MRAAHVYQFPPFQAHVPLFIKNAHAWQVWSTRQQNHVAQIPMKANVCCVNFSPTSPHSLAVGSADHNVHLYDLRAPDKPLHIFAGAACVWPSGHLAALLPELACWHLLLVWPLGEVCSSL